MDIDDLANALAARLNERQQAKTRLPFGIAYDTYMTLYARSQCRSWRNMERLYASYLAHWSDRDVSEISRLDAQTLHVQLAERVGKTTANRVIQFGRALINKLIDLETLPADYRNPFAGVQLFQLQTRDRFLEKDEIDRLFAAVCTLRYEITKDFIYMCLFTAARRDNVAAMRWEDLNLDRRVWRIPRTKNGSSQYLPLTDQALAVLQRRKRNNPPGSPWVFPSRRSSSGRLTKPERAWREVIERAGIPNARLHDLRRTLASWQALTGANLPVIAASLGHKDLKSTQVYARLNLDAIRLSMETATETLLLGVKNHE